MDPETLKAARRNLREETSMGTRIHQNERSKEGKKVQFEQDHDTVTRRQIFSKIIYLVRQIHLKNCEIHGGVLRIIPDFQGHSEWNLDYKEPRY